MEGNNPTIEKGTEINKLNGAIADNAVWTVVDVLEDFGGEVTEATVESESEYKQFDGRTAKVNIKDIGTEWEVLG